MALGVNCNVNINMFKWVNGLCKLFFLYRFVLYDFNLVTVFLVNYWPYWIQGDLHIGPSLLNHNFLTILEASSNRVYNIRLRLRVY